MTVTGDWTVVKGEGSNLSGSMESVETETASITTEGGEKRKAVRFPCIEQPPRYALRCNGTYLGGTKKGRLVGRKQRTEHDEWTIAFVGATAGEASNGATSTVTIQNHKHGKILSVVPSNKTDSGKTVFCVSPKQTQSEKDPQQQHDLGLGESDDAEEEKPAEQLPDDEDQDAVGEEEEDPTILPTTADQEDLQWCVIRCSDDDHPNGGGVMIVSLKTGDSLGVSENGQIALLSGEPSPIWEMECVTGELCFLSNPALDARVRCDMTGLLTLSPNWKGWEVVRITEVAAPHSSNGGIGDGYVRISSWMHSQWFLCSDETGRVATCSVAESLAAQGEDPEHRCSKWAIEKYPTDQDSLHEGVIIRSVTHGRLLSIKDGLLRTYDPSGVTMESSSHDGFDDDDDSAILGPSGSNEDRSNTTSTVESGDPIGDMVKHHTEEMKRRSEEFRRGATQWWKQSLTNVQKTLSESAIQRRNSQMVAAGKAPSSPAGGVPQEATIVWQLEAAHQQTYYFYSISSLEAAKGEAETTANEDKDEVSVPTPPRSIGTFPNVTDNLRNSDKIQLVRNDEKPETLKLFLPEEQFYITCSSKGSIFATKQEEDEGSEWILEEQADGSCFRSEAHGLYLSLRNEEAKTPPPAAFAQAGEDNSDASPKADSNNNNKMKNPFENLKDIKLPHQKPKTPIAELCAIETPTPWKLEPCTPRAISSKRLKTFAIGTSIAVGTTIAMPFALAGVAAAMGALGAEAGIGFGIVAAGLSGAEALASVGAIGATAYFCFRPEENSLRDDLEPTHSASNPWSKRPFGNWRNW